jgi:inosine triphosphate pyrophosphatase
VKPTHTHTNGKRRGWEERVWDWHAAWDRENLEEGEPITFVTGNPKKLQEMAKLMSMDELPSCDEEVCSVFDEEEERASVILVAKNLDLPELQGDPEEVAREKALVAYSIVGGPVLVEDSSLCFEALNGLPGVYVKWFMRKLGTDGLVRLLESYEDKSAHAVCIFAYYNPAAGHEEPELFVGRTDGKIVAPRGPAKGDYDFDVIFEPTEGEGHTYAEMGLERKNKISQRSRALDKLKGRWSDFAIE